MPWYVYLILGVIFLVIGPMFGVQFAVGRNLFFKYLVRNEKENWTREIIPGDKEEEKMKVEGEEFYNEFKSFKKDVSIISDNLKLVGEFYDLGYKRTVLIVAGRSEALRYSYYFANSYKNLKYNILVIDNRSHGLSEGKYNYLGFKEYLDLINWMKYLHDELNQEEIIGHGICIGATTLLYAATSKEIPEYFKGIVTEGMYVNFPESFKNHAYEAGYPAHFVYDFFFMYVKKYIKIDYKYGPIDCIDKLDLPILFLYSKKDQYSKPDKSLLLYNKCSSNKKEIVWFDEGKHSRVRINNQALYDDSIKLFINKNFD